MHHQDWVSFACLCGFRLERLPRGILDDLPRCLGCGRDLRRRDPAPGLRTQGIGDVRGLR